MRQGTNPHILLNTKGQMFALATGADHTSEHEWGSKPMLEALTDGGSNSPESVANWLRSQDATWPARLQTPEGRAALEAAVPDLIAERRIKHDLDNLKYEERQVDGELEAALTFHVYGRDERPFDNVELRFRNFSREPKDIAGAWDDKSFGFRVRGEKLVKRLREFADALKAGRGVFAGKFLRRDGDSHLSGVIIAIEDMLRPEHKAEVKAAQALFVSDVELHLRARLQELLDLNRELCQRRRGMVAIWPVWANRKRGTEIAYSVNPGYGCKLPYSGQYGFEALRDWLAAGAPNEQLPVQADVAGWQA